MVAWNVGSVAAEVYTLIENVPSNLSGAPIQNIATRKCQYVEDYAGLTVDSTNIPVRFQGIVLNLTISEVAQFMNIIGVDANSISLGDFSINKGGNSNLDVISKQYQELAMLEMKAIGRNIRTYKSNG